MPTDIASRKDIEFLLDKFYERAFADDVIGFIFTEVTHLDLTVHLPIIANFWEDMLLGSHHYNGNPVKVHQQIDKLSELNEQQFNRWLFLWQITIDEFFTGLVADEARQRAGNIAKIMMVKILQNR
ncbi:group III truncated hemoglobin [Mucilaginibacter sp. AW1-3]